MDEITGLMFGTMEAQELCAESLAGLAFAIDEAQAAGWKLGVAERALSRAVARRIEIEGSNPTCLTEKFYCTVYRSKCAEEENADG